LSYWDYGSGKHAVAQRALERVGADVTVTADRAADEQADGLGGAGRGGLRGVHGRVA